MAEYDLRFINFNIHIDDGVLGTIQVSRCAK